MLQLVYDCESVYYMSGAISIFRQNKSLNAASPLLAENLVYLVFRSWWHILQWLHSCAHICPWHCQLQSVYTRNLHIWIKCLRCPYNTSFSPTQLPLWQTHDKVLGYALCVYLTEHSTCCIATPPKRGPSIFNMYTALYWGRSRYSIWSLCNFNTRIFLAHQSRASIATTCCTGDLATTSVHSKLGLHSCTIVSPLYNQTSLFADSNKNLVDKVSPHSLCKQEWDTQPGAIRVIGNWVWFRAGHLSGMFTY